MLLKGGEECEIWKNIKAIGKKEKLTTKEVENEIQKALCSAGLDCTAKEFIEITSFFINKRRYIA